MRSSSSSSRDPRLAGSRRRPRGRLRLPAKQPPTTRAVMANPRAFVNRRTAVRNIRKITRTMELISTTRAKKAMDRTTPAAAYTGKIAELAADLSATATDISHPLLQKREEVKNSLLLVICSNRGLCGGYNAGILREAAGRIRQIHADGIT